MGNTSVEPSGRERLGTRRERHEGAPRQAVREYKRKGDGLGQPSDGSNCE